MKEENINKTTFRTHQGHNEWLIIPFGLCRNRNRDGTTNKKENGFKKRFGVATIVILENYGKP